MEVETAHSASVHQPKEHGVLLELWGSRGLRGLLVFLDPRGLRERWV